MIFFPELCSLWALQWSFGPVPRKASMLLRAGWGTNQSNSKKSPLLPLWSEETAIKTISIQLGYLVGKLSACCSVWVTKSHWTTNLKGSLYSDVSQTMICGYICRDPWIPIKKLNFYCKLISLFIIVCSLFLS